MARSAPPKLMFSARASRAGRPLGVASVARVAAHGAWCLARAAVSLLAAAAGGRAAAARALHLGAFGAGRLGGLVGLHHAEYRVIRGS